MCCDPLGLLPWLIKLKTGTIINLSGLSTHRIAVGRSQVISSNAGLDGLSRALALEPASYEISVDCIVPGMIETTQLRNAPSAEFHNNIEPPVGCCGSTADVASAIAYLAGNQARYITGQLLHELGGLQIG